MDVRRRLGPVSGLGALLLRFSAGTISAQQPTDPAYGNPGPLSLDQPHA
ncbi:MAG: hypothetical protein QOK25_562 [Thermoleophilaceae bacterium]|nr:hypothetical protein [Thermoleophilaceae bacterium]